MSECQAFVCSDCLQVKINLGLINVLDDDIFFSTASAYCRSLMCTGSNMLGNDPASDCEVKLGISFPLTTFTKEKLSKCKFSQEDYLYAAHHIFRSLSLLLLPYHSIPYPSRFQPFSLSNHPRHHQCLDSIRGVSYTMPHFPWKYDDVIMGYNRLRLFIFLIFILFMSINTCSLVLGPSC